MLQRPTSQMCMGCRMTSPNFSLFSRFRLLAHESQTSVYLKIYMCNDELLFIIIYAKMEYEN